MKKAMEGLEAIMENTEGENFTSPSLKTSHSLEIASTRGVKLSTFIFKF